MPRKTPQQETGQQAPQYLKPSDIATITGLSLCTVKREIARGNLRRVKIGGSNLIRRDWFDAFLAARTTGGAE